MNARSVLARDWYTNRHARRRGRCRRPVTVARMARDATTDLAGVFYDGPVWVFLAALGLALVLFW